MGPNPTAWDCSLPRRDARSRRFVFPVCFNTGSMDRQRAQQLHALLSQIEPELAEPALQPLERLLTRPDAGDALIVALVGASGVGKSQLVNVLAGARVVTAGPLRPTTTEIAIWGDISEDYIPGRRVPGPNRPDRVVLVDTPPTEHYPDTVADLLHRVDAVLFVISPDRYADAITATLLETVRERAIPTRIVLSTADTGADQFDALVRDAEIKYSMVIEAIVTDDAGPLRTVLTEMVHEKEAIIERRDRAAATFAAVRAEEVAETLGAEADAARILMDRADAEFRAVGIDEAQLAAAADLDWDYAAVAISGLAREATDRAIAAWAEGIERDGLELSGEASPSGRLPEIDMHPINAWHQVTSDEGTRAVRRRWLHPRRVREVRDQLWRLAIDFGRRPTKRVRKAVTGQLPDLRIDGRSTFVRAIRDAGTARIEAFKAQLDPLGGVSPGEIKTAAEALAIEASALRGSTVADDE